MKPKAADKSTIGQRIAEAIEPRDVLVTCDQCFADYLVTYEHGVRVGGPHLCTGVRPPAADDRLVV